MMLLEANGRSIEAEPGDTIPQALKRAGLHVPTLCHLEGLLPTGTCRMCVVEAEGMGGLIPSCSYPAAAGMKIRTSTPRS
jgi:NADH dehydrogenase/NADH:ubiquinone oxidoreductase subunit G